jgi:ankyrin repeat protein
MASNKGHIEIVHELLEKGANIEATYVSIDMIREYV